MILHKFKKLSLKYSNFLESKEFSLFFELLKSLKTISSSFFNNKALPSHVFKTEKNETILVIEIFKLTNFFLFDLSQLKNGSIRECCSD